MFSIFLANLHNEGHSSNRNLRMRRFVVTETHESRKKKILYQTKILTNDTSYVLPDPIIRKMLFKHDETFKIQSLFSCIMLAIA